MPTLRGTFCTIEDARQAFAAYRNYGSTFKIGNAYRAYVAYIAESDFDEDGDFVSGSEYCDFSAAPVPADVIYEGGIARDGDHAVDYMLVKLFDGTELYAEADPVDGDETATYEPLKAAILDQAAEKGISPDQLHFLYD